MTFASSVQPQLLSQMNERSVLRILQSTGPSTRAEVTRKLGATAPTVSKAVASLLRSGLLEEFDATESGRGRPAKRLRLATETAQVLGLVIDAGSCRLVKAGLDGKLVPDSEIRFATPATYGRLLQVVRERVETDCFRPDVQTLGLGISMPGLIDARDGSGILSPNVPITNGHSPARDLSDSLGIQTFLLQECHALCLAERHYGSARGLDNFAMLDATTGVGLGIFSDGRLLSGSSGQVGEIGHLPIDANGPACGCGRNGCLETLAGDTALSRLVSKRTGRDLQIEAIVELVEARELSVTRELNRVSKHLAFALTTVINLFNPSTLFVCSRMFDVDPSLFDRLVSQTEAQSLAPSFRQCRIERARGSKREGAIAGVIERLTDSRVRATEPEIRGLQ